MNMTPKKVSEFVSFVSGQQKWMYQQDTNDMPSLQAEGVAGLCNRLNEYGVALLADEVGTGKTFQALSLAAIKIMLQPNTRVLILTPRQAVADQWPGEFATLVKDHFKEPLKKEFTNKPIPVLERLHCTESECEPNIDWISKKGCNTEIDLKTAQIIVGKFSSLSYLKSERDSDENYLRRLDQISESLCLSTISLVIIDEAHYFRRSSSNRYTAISDLFKKLPEECQFLLMTATPIHSSENDLANMLTVTSKDSYFKDDTVQKILEKIAIRRFRRLKSHTKHQYRLGQALNASFEQSPESELFFAMYQRQLVKKPEVSGSKEKGNLKKYLEGIEFDPVSLEKAVVHTSGKGQEHFGDKDYLKGLDAQLLLELVRIYKSSGLGDQPSNPKYLKTVDEIWRLIWSEEPKDSQNTQKVLVFSRRIASTQELTSQILRKYDNAMWQMILKSLGEDRDIPANRQEFEGFISPFSPKGDESVSSDNSQDKDDLTDTLLQDSTVLSWFRRVKEVGNSTAASRFRRLFENVKSNTSPFKQFFSASAIEKSLLTCLVIPKNIEKDKLAELLRKAVTQSSIGIVELFCCYLRAKEKNFTYDAFFSEFKIAWDQDQLRFKYEVLKMVEQYQIYCDKFVQTRSNSTWNIFDAGVPAYAYTGDTKNPSVIKQFNAPFFPKVLVATSVLQEGVNLHLNCKTVVHYGHAWTAGDDEQRIGRIDRIGSQIERELDPDANNTNNATLNIIYPYLANTHDESSLKDFLEQRNNLQERLDQLKGSDISHDENIDAIFYDVDSFLPKPIDYAKVGDPFPAFKLDNKS